MRCFGAVVIGSPFVHQRARIEHPWNLILHTNSSIGDRAHLYCLDHVEVHPGACVAQEVYVCTATHDFEDPSMSLLTSPITIGSGAFIGARAFILPALISEKEQLSAPVPLLVSMFHPKPLLLGTLHAS